MVEQLENNPGHFTNRAVLHYIAKSLPSHRRLEMAEHFRQCRFCRGKLRELAPNREQDILRFFAADILDLGATGREEEAVNVRARKNALAENLIAAVQPDKSKFQVSTQQIIRRDVFRGGYSSQRALAALAGALLLIVTVALLGAALIFNNIRPVQTKLTATVDAIENKNTVQENSSLPTLLEGGIGTPQTTINQSLEHPQTAAVKMPNRKLNSNKILNDRQANYRLPASQKDLGKTQTELKKTEIVLMSRNRNYEREAVATISDTRGTKAIPKCNADSLEAEIETTPQQITFRWKKLDQAASYHLYVSDDSQILLEEFETASETSYAMKKQLERGKTYRWKIVASLTDGRMVFGRSNSFTVGEKMKKDLFQKKGKTLARCIQ